MANWCNLRLVVTGYAAPAQSSPRRYEARPDGRAGLIESCEPLGQFDERSPRVGDERDGDAESGT